MVKSSQFSEMTVRLALAIYMASDLFYVTSAANIKVVPYVPYFLQVTIMIKIYTNNYMLWPFHSHTLVSMLCHLFMHIYACILVFKPDPRLHNNVHSDIDNVFNESSYP